jgi:predicted nucleic acid-binding protein
MILVDSSVWFAAVVAKDARNRRAKEILASTSDHVITDHTLVESWLLLNSKYGRPQAERFWDRIRNGAATIERVTADDLEVAWVIGERFVDQRFSIVDRTSFALMERLGITRAASFDHHFAVYRYGFNREHVFDILN